MKSPVKISLPNSRIKIPAKTVAKKTGYETLSEAIKDLYNLGYTRDFNILAAEDCLQCNKTNLRLSPDDFQIDATYRFEGSTDPGDEMILFAISSISSNIKGIVVNAFGMYADTDSSKIVDRLLNRNNNKKAPIKRHPALVQLSRDHHFGLLLVWKIRQGIKKDIAKERISNYILFFFNEDLKDHFKEEETNIFSKLPEDNPLYIQAISEHTEIYKLVEKIKQNPENETLLTFFADTLEKHIRFEERSLFNYLQEILSEEELVDLIKEDTHQKENIDLKWNDQFWAYKQ